MPYSYVQYTGTGTAPLLSVPFPYLLKSHVHIYIGYNLLTDTFQSELIDGAAFTWVSATQVQLSTIAAGTLLTIIRKTPTSTRLVDWNDASNLLAGDMDTADLQNLYAVQEQQDRVVQAAAVADAANEAISDVLLYTPIANVASIPGSPTNGDRIELTDSTGIESFSPLSGRPAGFVGSNQLRVRMYWNSASNTWIWESYWTTDSDGRYVRQSSISNSVNSASQATVASSLAVKTAKDAADAAAVAATAASAAAAAAQATADAPVTTAKLADGALAASAAGLLKMADGFFTAGALAKFADGFLEASAAGRAKMADGFVNTAKLEDGAVTTAKLAGTVQNLLSPTGAVQFFPATAAPAGWLKANGASLSRTAYAGLWAYAQASGNLAASQGAKQAGQFGPGDGSTTFTLPDLRGEFVRGWDDSRGVDSGRGIGSAQAQDYQSHGHGVTDPGHGHSLSPYNAVAATASLLGNQGPTPVLGSGSASTGTTANGTGISIQNSGGTETRPRNVALLACIKF